MGIVVGITPGLHYIGRDPQLANIIKKVGFTLTRGASAIEVPVDYAHEVTYTHGKAVREIAKKQGLTLNLHGDLAVPFENPERTEWRTAQDRVKKSLRSAVFVGATYIDFHASLGQWLEMISFGGHKMTAAFVGFDGKHFRHLLKENEKLRKWFMEKRYGGEDRYAQAMATDKDSEEAGKRKQKERDKILKRGGEIENNKERKKQEHDDLRQKIDERIKRDKQRGIEGADRYTKPEIDALNKIDDEMKSINREITDINEQLRVLGSGIHSLEDPFLIEVIEEKLARGGEWKYEEVQPHLYSLDGYIIMANYLFLKKDSIWVAMVEQYKDLIEGVYKLDYNDPDWFDKTWHAAEYGDDPRSLEFKEFFYAVVAAKYLEGHLKKAFEWLYGDFIKKDLPSIVKDKEELAELSKIARSLIIGIENPDARDPNLAGFYHLWRPKQIYAAIKTIRKNLGTDKVMMIPDFEHVATQGVDALIEAEQSITKLKDFGEMVICVHSNHPNPTHPHDQIDIGDITIYKLLYILRKTGLGKKRTAFIIHERGGGQDPYKRSVEALKIMAHFIEKETKPEDLPLEFYGMGGWRAGDTERQRMTMIEHTMDPITDLLKIPQEQWRTFSKLKEGSERQRGKGGGGGEE